MSQSRDTLLKPFSENDDTARARDACCLAPLKDLNAAGKLGNGSFGQVYKCPSDSSLAVKVLHSLEGLGGHEAQRNAELNHADEVNTLNMLNSWGISASGYYCKTALKSSKGVSHKHRKKLRTRYITRTMNSNDLAQLWIWKNMREENMPRIVVGALLECTKTLDDKNIVLLDLSPSNAFLVPSVEKGKRNMIIIDPGNEYQIVDTQSNSNHIEATVYTVLLWCSYYLADFNTETRKAFLAQLNKSFFSQITIESAIVAIRNIDAATTPKWEPLSEEEIQMEESGNYTLGLPVAVKPDGTRGYYLYQGATYYLLHYLVKDIPENTREKKEMRKRITEEAKDCQASRDWYFDNYVSVDLKELFE